MHNIKVDKGKDQQMQMKTGIFYNIVRQDLLLLGISVEQKKDAEQWLKYYQAKYPDKEFAIVQTGLKQTRPLPYGGKNVS